LTITATSLRARLCNDVHGAYRLVGRRIEAVEPPWPHTERNCGAREQRLEHRSWLDATRSPSITMLDPDRLRITSASGSIDFERRR
jgi:hypothetical protein